MSNPTSNTVVTVNQNDLKKIDLDSRQIFLNSNISEESVQDVILAILEINRRDTIFNNNYKDYQPMPIKLIIDSYGGSVYAGLALATAMKNSKTPIHTYCYGKAMSMGFLLFVMGDERYVSEYATLMYHQLSGGYIGKLYDMIDNLHQMTHLQEKMDKIILGATNIPEEMIIKAKETKTDWFIDFQQALDLGIADKLM